ncbi:hypothetical protein I552_6738 [Mycobacterium xenopi 3993]|nr:hypothetical protein I552_6738 [Mycobacterium xenopi 3993]
MDAATTPVIIRSFDGATAIGATVLASPVNDCKQLAVQANRRHRHAAVDPRHGTGALACRCTGNEANRRRCLVGSGEPACR